MGVRLIDGVRVIDGRRTGRPRDEDPRDPKQVVREGYDRISYAYRDDVAAGEAARYAEWLRPLMSTLPAGSEVLDLGCGAGTPGTRLLASRFRVTGVDLSPVQIERARRLVPQAHFILADMTNLDLPEASFDAVVSLYAVIHVPIEEQRGLFRDVHRWLRPGGYLLVTVGSGEYTGVEDDWLESGTRMYWSHADEATYRAWLGEIGFVVHDRTFIPEGAGGHVLLFAERASVSRTADRTPR